MVEDEKVEEVMAAGSGGRKRRRTQGRLRASK